MKIIISPAKSLNFDKDLPTSDFSFPEFLNESKSINDVLKTKNPKHLKDLMKISDKIAELNWNRNLNFETPFNPNNARPALFTFDGDVYSGIDSFTLSENNIKKAQASLMQAYRLEMGTKLAIGSHKNLYDFWNNKITNSLNIELDSNELFINLASNEYSAVINKNTLKVDMISPVFKDFKNGQFKIISFYAKKARGMMTRFLLENDIKSINDLKQFDYGGYSFSSQQSEISKELVFTR